MKARPTCSIALLAGFFLGAAVSRAAEPAPLVYGETLAETAVRTGYTEAELRKYFPSVKVEFDFAGFARDRFKAPPAPGIHPRVFFNPEDVPELRRRFKETAVGRQSFAHLVKSIAPGGSAAKRTARLALEAYRCLIEDDAEGGRRIAAEIAAAAASMRTKLETTPASELPLWQSTGDLIIDSDTLPLAYDFAHQFMDETQRATVRATIAKATNGAWGIGLDNLPAWEANMMNWGPWITGRLITAACALEGEPGHDPHLYPRLVQMFRHVLTLAFMESGAGYEGMAKNLPALRNVIPMTKRGDLLIAATHALAYVRKFRLHTMVPWGGAWTEDGNWGGSANQGNTDDFVALKWAFPNDPVVDFQYRNALEIDAKYSGSFFPSQYLFPEDWHAPATWEQSREAATKTEPLAFFCNDIGLVTARSSWERDAAALYFVPRNLLDGHRHANRNTLVFHALGRTWIDYTRMAGGSFVGDITESSYHSVVLIDDRGQALGPPAKMVSYVDQPLATFGVGDARLAYSVRQSRPDEKPLVFTPNEFRLHRSSRPWMDLPWQDLPDWYSSQKLKIGDRRHRPYRGDHPYDPIAVQERTWERAWSLRDDPVQRAYRTAGLVRGPHPYALIVDDVQCDDRPHLYKFLLQLSDDLELESIAMSDNGGKSKPELQNAGGSSPSPAALPHYMADFILREGAAPRRSPGDGSRDRRLLVRVLENDSVQPAGEINRAMGNRYNFDFAPAQPLPIADGRPGMLETYVKYARNLGLGKRLVIPSRSVRPNFKLLLFAHRPGEPLPITRWNPDRTQLTVTWQDQTDAFTFVRPADGRTRFTLTRAGAATVAVE